ncbi:MAG: glycerophosphodiester phosphodiesterase family protein [Steroidobacteraceae bacterium]
MIGHRGASGAAPEHTLTAYRIAVEQGADYIEPDLVSTRDGVLIARHENEIGGTTDVAQHAEFAVRRTRKLIDGAPVEGWFAEDFTLAEIKRLKARERIPELRAANARLDGQLEVPTLEEILALVEALEAQRAAAARAGGAPLPARIGVYPETKHPSYFAAAGLALEQPLLEALRRFGYTCAAQPVFIQSFEVGNLQALRRTTGLKLVQLIEARGGPYDLVARGAARSYAELVTREGLAAIAAYADAVGVAKSLILPVGADGALGRPTRLVEDAHGCGLDVHAWTFRAENAFLPPALRSSGDPAAHGQIGAEIAAYLAAGIDGFFIDQPALGVRARDEFLAAAR